LTSVPDLAVGDQVVLKEVNGDFTTPAVVRQAFTGRDNIARVGLEFVGQTAPDRLVLTDSERTQTPPQATPAGTRPPERPMPAPQAGAERRKSSRLSMSVDIVLCQLRPDGSKGREERTVLDNISRGGARALTSMTYLKPGDRVALREIGGDFETEAIVRNAFVSPDRIPRLGLEFVGKKAPDRLVPAGEATGRMRRDKRRRSGSPDEPR
jgi:hypothetical protein